MAKPPEIRFLVSSAGCLVPPDATFLGGQIPLSRPSGESQAGPGPTYGKYLDGIKELLLDHADLLLGAVTQSAGKSGEVDRYDIIVEKHGSDYHPARVRAYLGGDQISLVANVALTERGLTRLASDFHWLDYFAHHFRRRFVPRVHFLTESSRNAGDSGNPVLRMFVGEWLEGYHEFHLTRREERDEHAVAVWDAERGHVALSSDGARELFRKAAFALTYYYDVSDFREVFPWHHAAGDFVVHANAEVTDVKLVTVRQYGPRVVFPNALPENRVTACLLFLANLTIRMRLDRLDGIGELAWADETCVDCTIKGFLRGLREQIAEGRCDTDFFRLVAETLENMSLADWVELFRDSIDSYDQDAPDMPIVRENLVEHIFTVSRVIREFLQEK